MNEDLQKPDDRYKASGGFRGRSGTGHYWRRVLTERAQLQPGDSVLDVGCGLGRMAVALMPYVTGRYEGFDIDENAVRWCRENITPKAPNFRFQAVAVQNNRYNRDGGLDAETFRFPYGDETFDLAFLASVFTHLLPKSVANYVRELRRVLKPGGRCVASYMLLNEQTEKAIAAGLSRPKRNFPHSLDGCRVQLLHLPEAAVAHYEASIRRLYEETGFRIDEVTIGGWSTNRKPPGGQDVVIATRL